MNDSLIMHALVVSLAASFLGIDRNLAQKRPAEQGRACRRRGALTVCEYRRLLSWRPERRPRGAAPAGARGAAGAAGAAAGAGRGLIITDNLRDLRFLNFTEGEKRRLYSLTTADLPAGKFHLPGGPSLAESLQLDGIRN